MRSSLKLVGALGAGALSVGLLGSGVLAEREQVCTERPVSLLFLLDQTGSITGQWHNIEDAIKQAIDRMEAKAPGSRYHIYGTKKQDWCVEYGFDMTKDDLKKLKLPTFEHVTPVTTEAQCEALPRGTVKQSCTNNYGSEDISFCLGYATKKIGRRPNHVNSFLLLSDYNPMFNPSCDDRASRKKKFPSSFDPNFSYPSGSKAYDTYDHITPEMYYGSIDYYQYIPFYMAQCSSTKNQYNWWYKEDLQKLGYDPADHWRYYNPGAVGMADWLPETIETAQCQWEEKYETTEETEEETTRPQEPGPTEATQEDDNSGHAETESGGGGGAADDSCCAICQQILQF